MEVFTIHVKFIGNKFDGVDEAGRFAETYFDIDSLNDAVKRLTDGAAAQMGLIEEITVVDDEDCTNFHWIKGRVMFPAEGCAFLGPMR